MKARPISSPPDLESFAPPLSPAFTSKLLSVALLLASLLCLATPLLTSAKEHREGKAAEAEVAAIGSRLELFVDGYLIDRMLGVTRKLHSPQPRDVAITFDSPWDGSCSTYVSLFQDGDRYRMYYRGLPIDKPVEGLSDADFWKWITTAAVGKAVTCYAESKDGIHWSKPNLGLFKDTHTGTTQNNIVLVSTDRWPNATDNLVVFKDANPACPPEARYKAVGRQFLPGGDRKGHTGNLAFQSPDGIHWKLIQDRVIYEDQGHVFDAQNPAFFDPLRKLYVEYHRKFRTQPGHPMNGMRDVRTSTSADFIHWTEPQFLEYGGAAGEHFNQLSPMPYFRAPHIYLAFGDRLVETRDDSLNHPAKGISDTVFLSSRDGLNFDRSFMEAWIRPGLDVRNWIHAGTMPAWGLLQTGPEELSVYWIQHYYQVRTQCYLQRGTLRLDGFVSVNAPFNGGEFATKLLTFDGAELVINYATSAVGSVQVEIQDMAGRPIAGFAAADCPPIFGDEIEHVVKWAAGSNVSPLAGRPLRLRFILKDADVYSMRFPTGESSRATKRQR